MKHCILVVIAVFGIAYQQCPPNTCSNSGDCGPYCRACVSGYCTNCPTQQKMCQISQEDIECYDPKLNNCCPSPGPQQLGALCSKNQTGCCYISSAEQCYDPDTESCCLNGGAASKICKGANMSCCPGGNNVCYNPKTEQCCGDKKCPKSPWACYNYDYCYNTKTQGICGSPGGYQNVYDLKTQYCCDAEYAIVCNLNQTCATGICT